MSQEPLPQYLHRLIRVYKSFFTHSLLIDDTYGIDIKELRIHLFMRCDFFENQFDYGSETFDELPSVEESLAMYKEVFKREL